MDQDGMAWASKFCYGLSPAGCKESLFYNLPFPQAVASMY